MLIVNKMKLELLCYLLINVIYSINQFIKILSFKRRQLIFVNKFLIIEMKLQYCIHKIYSLLWSQIN